MLNKRGVYLASWKAGLSKFALTLSHPFLSIHHVVLSHWPCFVQPVFNNELYRKLHTLVEFCSQLYINPICYEEKYQWYCEFTRFCKHILSWYTWWFVKVLKIPQQKNVNKNVNRVISWKLLVSLWTFSTGVIIWHQYKHHALLWENHGKSFKILIYLHCLIPPKWVI